MKKDYQRELEDRAYDVILARRKLKKDPNNPALQRELEDRAYDVILAQRKLKENKPTGFIDTVTEGVKNFAKGVSSNIERASSALNKLVATGIQGSHLPEGLKETLSEPFTNASKQAQADIKRISEETKGSKMALAGEILGDPLVLAPGGLIRTGSKLARMGKSAVAGAGIGAGMQGYKNYAEGEDITDNMLLGAGAGAGVNAIISAVTKGKIRNVDELQKLVGGVSDVDDMIASKLSAKLGKPQANTVADKLSKVDPAIAKEIEVQQLADDVSLSPNNQLLSGQTQDEINSMLDNSIEDIAKRNQIESIDNTILQQPNKTDVINTIDSEISTVMPQHSSAYGSANISDSSNYQSNLIKQEVAKTQAIDDFTKAMPEFNEAIALSDTISAIKQKQIPSADIYQYPDTLNRLSNLAKNSVYGGVGAVAGAGSEVTSAIQENRDIDMSQMLQRGIGGALLGYGISRGKYGLNIEKTLQEHPKVLEQSKVNRALKRVSESFKENRFVDAILGLKIREHKNYLDYRKNFYLALDKGNKEVEDIYLTLSKLSPEARIDLHEYLVGDKKETSKAMMNLADSLREKISSQGQKAVDLGILSQEAYDEWKDVYLFRIYDSTWLEDIKKRLRKQISLSPIEPRGKIWEGSQDELAQYELEGALGRLSEGKISATVNKDGTVTFRKDYTKEERTEMGEVVDGAFTVANTMQKLNQMLCIGKFLDDVSESGIALISKDKKPGYVELSGVKWGALNHKYVPQEIADDLKGLSNAVLGFDSPFMNMYQEYLRKFKKSKTVYNPTAHVNNIMGNATLMIANGYSLPNSLSFIMRDSLTLNNLRKFQDLKRSAELGLLPNEAKQELEILAQSESIQIAELADKHGLFTGSRLDEMLMRYKDTGIADSKFTQNNGLINKTLNKFQQAYQGEDNSARLSMFRQLIEKGYDPDEAVLEIRKIVPDYREPLSLVARTLRDTGIVPFISWFYYLFPVLLKNLNPLGTNTVGSGLSKYNAWNMTKILGTLTILDTVLAPNSSIFDEMPKGFEGKRLPIYEDNSGNVTALKVDRFVPHVEFANPLEMARSLAIGGIPQKVFANINDRDPYFNNKITHNEGIQGALDRAGYLAQNYIPLPQIAYDVAKIPISAMDKEVRRKDKVIEPRTLEQQLAKALLGINLATYNKREFEKKQRQETLRERKKEIKKRREDRRR